MVADLLHLASWIITVLGLIGFMLWLLLFLMTLERLRDAGYSSLWALPMWLSYPAGPVLFATEHIQFTVTFVLAVLPVLIGCLAPNSGDFGNPISEPGVTSS